MEVEIKDNRLSMYHVLKKNETYKVSKNSKWQTISIFKKPQDVFGYSSSTRDGKEIFIIDYDNVSLDIVLKDIEYLTFTYSLPSAFIFYTNKYIRFKQLYGSFHVVYLSKHYPTDILEMISKTHADVNYMTMPLRNVYRSWVLRLSPKKNRGKPKFLKVIKSQCHIYPISTAHKKLLSLYYPRVKIFKTKMQNEDLEKSYKINIYEAT